jgi:hypothetical protein
MPFVLLVLLLVGLQQPSFGQAAAPASEKKVTMSFAAPMPLSLLAWVNTIPQRPSLDDSLARRYYARNRVKTVALVHVREAEDAPDTLDYTELDRAGYPVLTAKPLFQARSHLRYNRRHQVISYTKDAEPGFTLISQTTYDPATRTTTTHVGPTLATLALYQTGHIIQRDKTSEYETFLLAVPGIPTPPVERIVLRTMAVGGDTLRFEVLGYHNEQLVKTESFYSVGRAPQQRENGSILLSEAGRPGQPAAAQYVPSQRHTYDAAGRLIRTQFLPVPPQLAAKPTIQVSSDERSTMTTTQINDNVAFVYVRNTDGQLVREELHGKAYASFNPSGGPPFTTYDYLPNGLRRSKTDNHGTRYEYRYTFY